MGRKKVRQTDYPLMDYMSDDAADKSSIANDTLKFFSGLKKLTEEIKSREDILRIKYLCPAESFLDNVTTLFWEKTDNSVSLAFWGGLCSMATYLTMQEIPIQIGCQKIFPNLWILAIAESGNGKTFTDKRMKQIIGDRIERIPGAFTSKAAIIEELKRTTGKGLIVRDEVAQQLKLMRNPAYITLKDAMLCLYDGSIEHTTKKEGRVVLDDLAISYFGCTVPSTLSNSLTAEDLVDGFLQRFIIYLTKPNERNMKNCLYKILDKDIDKLSESFNEWTIKSRKINKFILSPEAETTWEYWYHTHFNSEYESYYKRYMFAGIKYAAIYNTLIEKDGYISKENMGWAIRLIELSLDSLYNVMNNHLGFGKWEKSLFRLKTYIENNPDVNPRKIQMSLKMRADELFYILQNMYIERYGFDTLSPDIQRWYEKRSRQASRSSFIPNNCKAI
ncbi:MAG: DUF3987 domain-containing protein [Lentisphaerae bacterium]|nr:DUF3987 domain-containing protein [Lentisphaerota bacterium]